MCKWNNLCCYITHAHGFLFNLSIFPELLQVRPVPKSKLLGVVVAELLQAGCPSCHPTNSIKALKDDSVPVWGQHAAKRCQEHCDGCMTACRLTSGEHSSSDSNSAPDFKTAVTIIPSW